MSIISLKDVKKYYKGLPKQKQAVEYLGNLLLQTPAKSKLDLKSNTDWVTVSDNKLDWLQAQVSDYTLTKFTDIWRDKSSSLVVDWNDMNCPISKYFTVGEATNYQVARIPKEASIKNNILRLAKELDKVREAWGGPIIVTSWYRPPAINRAIGGARYSQHLKGSAVDIHPVNGQGRMFENWLDNTAWTDKALGYGQKAGRGFTHLDLRAGKIRWRY